MTVSITGTWLEEQAEAQRRSFQRALWVSAVLHLALGASLAFAPDRDPLLLPDVITVKLVAMAPSRLPPAPKAASVAKPIPAAPAPKPAPSAPKPVPVPSKVILPKQAPKVAKKRKPKPKALEYDDALAALRSELGEATPVPVVEAEPVVVAEAAPPPATPEQGLEIPPETAAWIKKTKIMIRQAWVVPAEFRNRALVVKVTVLLSASGEIFGKPEVVRSSGDPWFDDNAIRAVEKASPLPPPPEAGDWTLIFDSQE